MQGIGATGGVVNQVTVQPPRAEGLSGRVLLQGTAADSFDGDALSGKAGALVQYRSGNADVSFGATGERRGVFQDADGRNIGIEGAQGEIQDSDSYSFFGRFGYQLSDSARFELVADRFSLEGNGNYVPVPGDRATGLVASSVKGDRQGVEPSNRNELLSASLVEENLAGGTLNLQAFFNRSRDVFGGGIFGVFQDANIAPVGTLFEQSANRSRKLGGKVSYERELATDLTVLAGFDALFDRTEQALIQTDRVWVPETDFRSLAPFAQVNLGLFDRVVTLAGGVRWENVRLSVGDFTTLAGYGGVDVAGGTPSFEEVLPNAGVIIEPVDDVRFYGNFSKGYTIPDVGRILRAIDTPGVDIDNFLNMNPIVSDNFEIGAEVARGPLDASVTYFWSSSDFGQRLVRRGDGIFDLRREATEIEGLEIRLDLATPVEGFNVQLGYSDLEGRVDSDGDGAVDIELDGANISPDRFNLGATYRAGPLRALVQTQFYLSRNFEGGPRAERFEGYTLVNALVRYETGLGDVSLGVQNLLDEQYVDYNTDTVAATSNTRFFAGRGRTLTLGLERRF